MHVVLDHAVRVLVLAGDAAQLILNMGPEVHARAVPPDVERFSCLVCLVNKAERRGNCLVIDGLHSLLGKRASVDNFLLAAPQRPRMDHPARAKPFLKLRVFRVVLVFGLLLCIEVVKIAEELVESMVGRQMLVLVTEVVLAELTGGVSARLEQTGDCRIFRLKPKFCAWQSNLGQSSAINALAGDIGRSPCGA